MVGTTIDGVLKTTLHFANISFIAGCYKMLVPAGCSIPKMIAVGSAVVNLIDYFLDLVVGPQNAIVECVLRVQTLCRMIAGVGPTCRRRAMGDISVPSRGSSFGGYLRFLLSLCRWTNNGQRFASIFPFHCPGRVQLCGTRTGSLGNHHD
eukprot:gb/GECG01015128.1/.p1 GENE.gb/GECG01015128.1/~~gb/GECG01015128.1/.p1  ORF type:complete len:150 (+),score=2.50 gb/GECG01015128.1/:1-450(+)